MKAVVLVTEDIFQSRTLCVFRGNSHEERRQKFVSKMDVVGRPPGPGEAWALEAELEESEQYGVQHRVTSARLVKPSGRVIVDLMANNPSFQGIGKMRAQRTWDSLGESLYDALEAGETGPIAEVLNEELADVMVRAWAELGTEVAVVSWLDRSGMPTGLARKVLSVFGHVAESLFGSRSRLVDLLEDNPYRMLALAGWKKVDRAARGLGVAADDPRRVQASLETAASRALSDGHTVTSSRALLSRAAGIAEVPRSLCSTALDRLLDEKGLVQCDVGIQLPGCHVMEGFVGDQLLRMAGDDFRNEQPRLSALGDPAVEAIDSVRRSSGIELSGEQKAAVNMALREQFSMLVGGPGVGKTTTLLVVHSACEADHQRVIQAALSGRASQRMAEATGRPSSTIAALLARLRDGSESFADSPLLIIDEASMLDLVTLYRLLRYFQPGTRLLLVGDNGQLPPIGFGLTFHALLDDSAFARTELTIVRRQEDSTGIPAVCKAIRSGEPPTLPAFDGTNTPGVYQIRGTASELTNLTLEVLAGIGGVDAAQIISPLKRGAGGIHEINSLLHSVVGTGRPKTPSGLFVGERVMMTANDYDLGVMNGELGTVSGVADGALDVDFGRRVRIPQNSVFDLAVAYAITVHKSQGSQFERVIIPIRSSRILDRTLLLTAVSRGVEQVVIVGDIDAFNEAVMRPPGPSLRRTGIGVHLQKAREAA